MKLTHFDFHGGRGEPARSALSIDGIAFEDDRVPLADWERRRADTPFGFLPLLEVDDLAHEAVPISNLKLAPVWRYRNWLKQSVSQDGGWRQDCLWSG